LVTLLIVEDSVLVRRRLVSAISEIPGIEVAEAGTVEEAVRELSRVVPDVALLDIKLPDGTGIDVLRKVRGTGLKTTVIVLTNYATRQYRDKCVSAGADFFFDKSTEFEEAVEVIRRYSRV
jgi:DNA-binding NarL/FixJ family response regulator